MKKSFIALIMTVLLLFVASCVPPEEAPGTEKESPPLPPQKATEITTETWEIGGSLTYSQEAIRDDILIGMVNELERGKIVRQQIISYDLRSRKQKIIFELPVDRVVYDPPAVYGDSVVWSSVDRIEEEQQEAAKRAPMPNYDVFLLDLETGEVCQITTEEHAQVNPRIFEDTVVWLDARNVEDYYNPQRYDVYAYDIKTKTEKRLTSAPTAEGRDLSIDDNMVVWTDNRHADPPMDIHAGNEPGFNNEIYAYDLSTNQEERITDYPGNDRYPFINGNDIVWLRQLYQDYIKADVFLYDVVTGKEMQVSTSNYAAFNPSVDANRVVWADARVSLGNTSGDVVMNGIQGQADIYLYDLGTKQEIKLSSAKAGDVLSNPIIYGDYIVYTSVFMIGPGVYVVQLSYGITDITIQPEPGQILVYDKQASAGVILKSVTIKSDVCDRDYMDLQGHATVREGEPCLLVTGRVESQLDQDKYMTLSAKGYDVNGEEVSYVLDHGPIWGVISIFVPAKGTSEFVLHLKTAPDIVRIELMPSPELYDIPPP